MHLPRLLLIVLLAALAASCAPGREAASGEVCRQESLDFAGLVIAGSGAGLPLMRELASAWRADEAEAPAVYVAESIGSAGAVRAVHDGVVGVGVLSRPVQADERGYVEAVVPLAETLVVFGTHPSVGPVALRAEELVALFRGERRAWPDGTPVVRVVREAGDSGMAEVRRAWPQVHAAMVEARERGEAVVATTDQDALHALETIPGAIGLTDQGLLALSAGGVSAVAVDGVAPSWEAHDAGRYEARRTLHLVTGGDAAARHFAAFATASLRQGLYADAGYRPIASGSRP